MASSESSEPTPAEMRSFLERLISSQNRDLSMFIPLLLGFTTMNPTSTHSNSDSNSPNPDHNSENHSNQDEEETLGDRIVLINPLTQGMVVIEGEGLDSMFRSVGIKDGPPPASKSAIEALPSVEIRDGEEGECVICLEESEIGGFVKEMPCKHRFHSGCIEKWLGLHGSCPVCRFKMPIEEEDSGKKNEEEREGSRRRIQREIWVSFAFGRSRRTEDRDNGGDSGNDQNQSNQNQRESSE
ncbi:E3 ubiquitin-protein ligase MPSR1-like [Amaranthus tricolor]|uniref:E3 ubiquitin-protein ligase MPSR1-like n=1 Tax=Amaranthus tricolor TaxID=29722 RepID=UPI0025883DC1|nr:E3 ubiquitin-protein ligase MPSR1-like [Amaranthus tricolor]